MQRQVTRSFHRSSSSSWLARGVTPAAVNSSASAFYVNSGYAKQVMRAISRASALFAGRRPAVVGAGGAGWRHVVRDSASGAARRQARQANLTSLRWCRPVYDTRFCHVLSPHFISRSTCIHSNKSARNRLHAARIDRPGTSKVPRWPDGSKCAPNSKAQQAADLLRNCSWRHAFASPAITPPHAANSLPSSGSFQC